MVGYVSVKTGHNLPSSCNKKGTFFFLLDFCLVFFSYDYLGQSSVQDSQTIRLMTLGHTSFLAFPVRKTPKGAQCSRPIYQ